VALVLSLVPPGLVAYFLPKSGFSAFQKSRGHHVVLFFIWLVSGSSIRSTDSYSVAKNNFLPALEAAAFVVPVFLYAYYALHGNL